LDECIWEEPLPAWRDVAQSKLRWSDGPRVLWSLFRIRWKYAHGKFELQDLKAEEKDKAPTRTPYGVTTNKGRR
jgi:hypothetical protein